VIQVGLNSEVEHRGRVFHVQTESIKRKAPVVETLIYSGGEILVRMTASLAELAERSNLSGDDIRHALELQHWNLVRKIQHGMLGEEPPARVVAPPRREKRPSSDPRELLECNEPSVSELLSELRQRIDEVDRQADRRQKEPIVPDIPRAPRPWWKRFARGVSVVVRW
jgi:hypothetical protein